MARKDLRYLALVVSFFITLFSGICLLYAFDYVLDTKYYKQPSIPKPAKGKPFVDQIFGTTVTRVTDKTIDGYRGVQTYNGYPCVAMANCDDTYFISMSEAGDYNIYYGPASKTPYVLKKKIEPISASGVQPATNQSPHWSTADPDIIYYLTNPYWQGRYDGPRFYYYRVSTGTSTLIRDFIKDPKLTKWFTGANAVPCGSTCDNFHYIDWEEYNEPSGDQRYWPFGIYYHNASGAHLKAVFIYDKTLDSVISYTEDPNKIYIGTDKGMFSMSPSGNRIVGTVNFPGYNEYAVYDRNWNLISMFHGGHADMVRDAEGRDAIVGQLFAHLDGYDYVCWIDLEDGTAYGAIPNPNTGHYSGHCYSKPGWIFCSSYVVNGSWMDNSIYAVELDRRKAAWRIQWVNGAPAPREILNPANPCRVWKIAQSHTVYDTYTSITMGNISPSGNYLYYKGRWESLSDNIEVYQVTLPSTWYQDLKGNIQSKPDTTPPAKPTGLKILK